MRECSNNNGPFAPGYDPEPVGEVRHGPVHPHPVFDHMVRPYDWMMHVCHPYYFPNQPPPPMVPWGCGCGCGWGYYTPSPYLQSPAPPGIYDWPWW